MGGGLIGADGLSAYPRGVSVSLNTTLKPRPGWDEQQDPEERRRIEASADTYEEAYAALKAQVPEGWLVIGVKRW